MADLTGMMQAAAGSAGVEPGPPWDISTATYNGSPVNFFSTLSQVISPYGLTFKPDGTKMYVVDINNNRLIEYNLSSAWNLGTVSYVQTFITTTQSPGSVGVFFKPDGTKMYLSSLAEAEVNEYSLSTAWDISTASYTQNFSVSAQDNAPGQLFFRSDGTKMYIIGTSGDDVNEYTLSSAWNISTASYTRNFSVASQETSPQGLFFKSDGTKMYVCGTSGDDVNEYTLSTAWNISTASYLQNISVASNPYSLYFTSDGTEMFVLNVDRYVRSYDLSSAWNVSTATFTLPTTNYFSVASQEVTPEDIFFSDDGTKMYIIGASGDDVNQYTLSTPWDISTASYLQNFSVSAQDTSPTGLFFKPDGTKMYVSGNAGNDINEYALSSAWDISTASYVQVFSVGAEESAPQGLSFKPDGTKMYVVGSSGDDVNEYTLSSAWDISTASYVRNFSVAAQDSNPYGIYFRSDGAQMYIVGANNDNINEYNLSTAWNISTASYVQNFSVAGLEQGPSGVFFKPDGTVMYVIGSGFDAVFSYDL